MSRSSLEAPRDPEKQERAERWEGRLAIPVLVAALISVPAIFLMTTGGTTAAVGRVLNWLSLAVLVGESVLLLALSRDIADWLRAHKWELALVGLTVPAVVFAIGPVQLLRLIFSVGTLRILRVSRIVRAGRVLVRKLGLTARRRKAVLALAALLAAAFGVIVLANPESRTRRVIGWVVDRIGPVPAALAALVLAVGLFFGVRAVLRTKPVRKLRAALRVRH